MSDQARGSDANDSITNKDAWDFFLHGPKDVFTCEFCSTKAHRGNPPDAPGAFYAEVDNKPAIICDECDQNYDWETIEARIQRRRRAAHETLLGDWLARFRTVHRSVTSRIPAPLSVHEVAPDRRASLVPETTVFLGRIGAVIGLALAVLAGVAIFAALAGALFVSPESGSRWFSTTTNIYRQWTLVLVARPFFVLGVIGLGYLAHLVDYQRHTGAPDNDIGGSRPRWHYLTVLAGVGLVGWFVWVLSQFDVLDPTFLAVGVLAWSIGSFALVYVLHGTLLEDRWSYGLRIHPALWKFPVQYAIVLMVYDGMIGLPGPESNAFVLAIVPPVIGLVYAARRYFAFSERGAKVGYTFEEVMYRLRQLIPWPNLEGGGDSPVTNQFGQIDESARDDRAAEATSSLDREQELRQTREWASYLESELHDREEQMQDLEARLAQVRLELNQARESDTEEGPYLDERDDLLTDLFDIRDNFQRALHAETILKDDAAADLSEGIELIDSQIQSILEREGVEEIDTSGEVDPTKHRVVKTVPADDADPGEIVDVYKLGYRLDDRVIREAHVVVAEEPGVDEEDDPTDENGRFKRGGNPT